MFDFDVGKLLIFGIVALAVIPPKDLPRVMRTVGQVVAKMRRMASEFQGQFMEAMKEADLESVKRELSALDESAKIGAAFDPAMAMRQEITRAVEGRKEIGHSEVTLTGPTQPSAEPVGQGAVAAEAEMGAPTPAPAQDLELVERPAAEAPIARGAAE